MNNSKKIRVSLNFLKLKFSSLNSGIIIILLLLTTNVKAQTLSDSIQSSKQEVYLLPDGKILQKNKLDSLENVWGKGRIAFQHNAEDDAKGIVHLVRITDEMLQKFEAQKNTDVQAFSKMLNTLAPDFELKDIQGTSWSLKKLRGKVVVLNFWFTSCAPCIHEMPELNKLVKTFENKNIAFLGLTFNSEKQIEGFLKKREFIYKLLPNSHDVDKAYNINSWPTSIVIDKNGYIKTILQSSPTIKEELETAINKLK